MTACCCCCRCAPAKSNGVSHDYKRHGTTTRRVVAVHFAVERPTLKPLPAGPFQAVLRLERRVTRDGMVSVGGKLYSVPDCTRRRAVEVHTLTRKVHIFEEGQ